MMKSKEVSNFLDKELSVSEFKDLSNNGLQVQNKGHIKRICCGVDASLEFFKAAAEKGANFLICHHGISWGQSLRKITDLNYQRIRFLIEEDMALYACHLPLDVHPVYGNNILICKALGIRKVKPFGNYDGVDIGFAGWLDEPTQYSKFKNKIEKIMKTKLQSMDFGKNTIRSIAVVSGSAADGVSEAIEKKIDVYLTGEPRLSVHSIVQENCINAVFAGHYATEVFGVRAIGDLITRHFKIPSEFIRFNIPF